MKLSDKAKQTKRVAFRSSLPSIPICLIGMWLIEREGNHYPDYNILMPIIFAFYIVFHIVVHLTLVWSLIHLFWHTSPTKIWNLKYAIPIGFIVGYLFAFSILNDPFDLLISPYANEALVAGIAGSMTAYCCIKERMKLSLRDFNS